MKRKGKGKGKEKERHMERKWKGKDMERERERERKGKWKGNCLPGAKARLACAILVCVCARVSQRYSENNPEQKIFPRMCHLSACVSKVYHTRLYRYMY